MDWYHAAPILSPTFCRVRTRDSSSGVSSCDSSGCASTRGPPRAPAAGRCGEAASCHCPGGAAPARTPLGGCALPKAGTYLAEPQCLQTLKRGPLRSQGQNAHAHEPGGGAAFGCFF
eukprot:2373107-Pyramimonas_sp.AAC.1